jgi:uncharacterized protein (DUF983 family)
MLSHRYRTATAPMKNHRHRDGFMASISKSGIMAGPNHCPANPAMQQLETQCPWCGLDLTTQPNDGVCPDCENPCGDLAFAVDVFEGHSRPRLRNALLAWGFVVLTGSLMVNSYLSHSVFRDTLLFGMFFLIISVIALAETHGLMLIRKGTGSRRLIATAQGIEVIDPHRMVGIASLQWPDVIRTDIQPAKLGGARIDIYAHGSPSPDKPSIKLTTALRTITPEQASFRINELHELADTRDAMDDTDDDETDTSHHE